MAEGRVGPWSQMGNPGPGGSLGRQAEGRPTGHGQAGAGTQTRRPRRWRRVRTPPASPCTPEGAGETLGRRKAPR
eukprot:12148170-Alexandrium_andersonii.AAC.1